MRGLGFKAWAGHGSGLGFEKDPKGVSAKQVILGFACLKGLFQWTKEPDLDINPQRI